MNQLPIKNTNHLSNKSIMQLKANQLRNDPKTKEDMKKKEYNRIQNEEKNRQHIWLQNSIRKSNKEKEEALKNSKHDDEQITKEWCSSQFS